MSKMNFDLNVEDSSRRKRPPWIGLLILLFVAGVVAWAVEPIVLGMWHSG